MKTGPQTRTLLGVLVSFALAACSDQSGAQSRRPSPNRVDQQLIAIRDELLPKLLAQNCSVDPRHNLECRNFSIPCAVEKPTSAADAANGVARKITFWTSYIARGQTSYGPWRSNDPRWFDVHDYIVIQVNPDGTWRTGAFGSASANADPIVVPYCRPDEPGERLHRF